MTAPFSKISELFRVKLNSLNGLPEIFWENIGKSNTVGTAHLVPRMIPVTGQLLDFEKRQINSGIYSIGIYTPLNKGEKQLLTIIDNIYTLFQDTLNLKQGTFTVDIMAISRSAIRRDDNFAMANIDIEWINYN